MKTRWKIMLAVGALLLAAWLAFSLCPSDGPKYRGKALSEWAAVDKDVWSLGMGDWETKVVDTIGTNALPYYLKWIEYKQPSWRSRVDASLRTPLGNRFFSFLKDKKQMRAQFAAFGPTLLGNEASQAAPALVRILTNEVTLSPEGCPYLSPVGERAALSLDNIGPQAIPPLAALLTNQNAPIRAIAPLCLVRLQGGVRVPIDAIMRNVDDPDPHVREQTRKALLLYHATAPKNGELATRTAATNAVPKIAPEALTNAPPRP